MRRLAALALVVLLSGCGGVQALKPASGTSLPVKPAAAAAVPTPTELMTPDDQARPQRSDEVLLRSEKRRDDPFDKAPD